MSAKIIQIVPRLPPSVSGVGDYAHLLARQLRDDHDIHSSFLVGDPTWDGPSKLNGLNVERSASQEANELEHLLRKLGAATVLLHYVGYGYHQRGCPLWLLRGLESWKKAGANHRLIVMFHELFASGMPWRSSFWTSPLQRRLARSLALLSDRSITNLADSGEILARMTGRPKSSFAVLPVFSNVGEATSCAGLYDRSSRLVVFGSAEWRRQAYHDHRATLALGCDALGIDSIVDIGPPLSPSPEFSVPVIETGVLAAPAISRHLAGARAGFFAYPAAYLGKSSIFAAYAAHGLLPITYGENSDDNQDGLCAGKHFLAFNEPGRQDQQNWPAIAQAAAQWYAEHRLKRQAQRYAEIFTAGFHEREHVTA
ncbi:MAG: glycosyltransferase family 1 protein [Candidatus Binatia bacterium]